MRRTQPGQRGSEPRGSRVPESPPDSVGFLRAFFRALLDPQTYDVRTNAGLWLGFGLAVPIPIMAAVLDAPPLLFVASLVAPPAWGVIVGAARRVGIIGEGMIRRMRLEVLTDRRVRDETYADLNLQVDTERGERRHLERLQSIADAELVLAQVVHESLVPSEIRRGDLDVAIRHVPCTYVGGDYLRVSLPRPDLLYLCIGDVAGHGVAAALVVSRIHALVRHLIQQEVRIGPFLDSLDHSVRRLLANTSLFMTFAIFRVDLAAREIEYATAGHPPQLLLRASGSVEGLITPNRPAGLELGVPRAEHVVGTTTYQHGDTLLLFTDGLFETMDTGDAQETSGEDKLMSLFGRLGHRAPSEVADAILAQVRGSGGNHPPDDDMSMIVAHLGDPGVTLEPRPSGPGSSTPTT